MSAPRIPRALGLAALAAISGALLVLLLMRPADDAREPSPSRARTADASSRAAPIGPRAEPRPAPPSSDGTAARRPGPEIDPEASPDPAFERALRWSAVDLDAVRRALPDNLYWEMSAPTSDPSVEQRREEERARWNEEYGKVLSGTASEEEIHDYYALRRRISEDAVEFAGHLLEHYGDVLPERGVGLLELADRLHRARLEEMPRRIAEARERKQV